MSKKNLLIGAVDLYDWSKIKTWANSIRETGYNGEVALLAYRVSDDVVEQAKKLSIDVYNINHDSFGQPIVHNDKGRDTQSHQLRFFHIWQLLSENNNFKNYEKVMITDVRDVYFQQNPFEWVDARPLYARNESLLASSEEMVYGDEIWGLDNMMNGFGPYVTEKAKSWRIYNVGVVFGSAKEVMELCLTIYSMTLGRYIPSDQSAYNVIVHELFNARFHPMTHDVPWACQCGTTLDPEKAHYIPKLQTPRPKIEDGIVKTHRDEPFVIVHQWDRVPELKKIIEAKY